MSSENESELILRVKKLKEDAIVPCRQSAGSVGYDLCSGESSVVPAKGKALIKTNVAIALPRGTYGRVAPRSSLAVKSHIDVGAGVIDPDYRGNVGVVLFNFADQDFAVAQGDRIAQLVVERVATPRVVQVDQLDDTERGSGGYGSTGK
jgi:dUTP diphosphatase